MHKDETADNSRNVHVTLLFTDIESSTYWWRTQPDAMRAALSQHDNLLEDSIAAYNGHLFKHTGDGIAAAFADPALAVRAALQAQIALHHAFPNDAPIPLRVRVALHTGDVVFQKGDYFGLPLSHVTRLLETLRGGQVCFSVATEKLVRDRLPHGATLGDLGEHRLRDLESREHIYRLLHADLPDASDTLRTLDTICNNLPAQVSSFVGRQKEQADLRKRLRDKVRLLTLTGAGGSGKTRLATQVGANVLPDYPSGVVLIELAALTESSQITATVQNTLFAALKYSPSANSQSPVEAIIALLEPLHLLIILDNCEHLIEETARVADILLRACPHLQILATSRLPLSIGGESLYPVLPLPLPPAEIASPKRLAQYAAIQLFVERARQTLPDFELTARNGADVASICRRLDGLPLALELAAGWIATLSPADLATQLDDRFDLLTGGNRTALPRHQTLRAMVDWSYRLLTKSEQRLFRSVAVFAGGWTLEAVQAVCTEKGMKPAEILAGMRALVDKSLVVREYQDSTIRYRLLETMREFARKLLEKDTMAAALFRRHREYFVSLAEKGAGNLPASEQKLLFDVFEHERENLLLVFAHADTDTRLRLCVGLHRFWMQRGFLAEGRSFLHDLLPASDAPILLRAKAENAAGVLALSAADFGAATAHLESASRLFAQEKDDIGMANTSANLGLILSQTGHMDEARLRLEQSLAVYRARNDDARTAIMLSNLGANALNAKDAPTARRYLEEALPLLQKQNNLTTVATNLHNQAEAFRLSGDLETAENRLRAALELRCELQDRENVLRNIAALAKIAAQRKRHDTAVRLLAFTETQFIAAQMQFNESEREQIDESIGQLKNEVGAESFVPLWEAGCVLTWEEAIGLALRNEP